ncbi:MAG: DegT/DnrJ/EryC1/StrS family aminotransferase, partial [Candidatus Omnitrophica bacterium]|nr:DegT/DnrJ/EryC1/StrS family aminotransferase [Candidatus Omnitrophota bacterium]
EEMIKGQRQKANYYLRGLKGVKGVQAITSPALGSGAYPYLTLLFSHPQQRNRFLAKHEDSGLGVSVIYTGTVNNYPYIKEILPEGKFPNAKSLCERHLTLSTSVFLKRSEQDRLIEELRNFE